MVHVTATIDFEVSLLFSYKLWPFKNVAVSREQRTPFDASLKHKWNEIKSCFGPDLVGSDLFKLNNLTLLG